MHCCHFACSIDTVTCEALRHGLRLKNENLKLWRFLVAFSRHYDYTARQLEYRVVPCPDYPTGRVIISPPAEPTQEQKENMSKWISLAQILSTL